MNFTLTPFLISIRATGAMHGTFTWRATPSGWRRVYPDPLPAVGWRHRKGRSRR